MKISLLGITGKMGRHLAELIFSSEDLVLVGGVTSSNNVFKGKKLFGVEVSDTIDFAVSQADVLIDFSTPQSLLSHLDQIIKSNKPLVMGTTGFNSHDYTRLIDASRHIPILHAPNTSMGVAVLSYLVQIAAQKLDLSYDIEISETHHREKRDAPSGTALGFGEAIAAGRQVHFDQVKVMNRKEKRQAGEIGFSVMRGGGVVGEHTIRFLGNDEIIEFSHTSLNRSLFAKGALRAARWLVDQEVGFYTMQDVVNEDS